VGIVQLIKRFIIYMFFEFMITSVTIDFFTSHRISKIFWIQPNNLTRVMVEPFFSISC